MRNRKIEEIENTEEIAETEEIEGMWRRKIHYEKVAQRRRPVVAHDNVRELLSELNI